MNVQAAPRPPLPILIDTDPGIDDTMALLLALGSPEPDLRGISVPHRNPVVKNATRRPGSCPCAPGA